MEDYTYKFREEIEVPEVVMQKADAAFLRIKTEEKDNMAEIRRFRKNKRTGFFKNPAAAAAAIAILAAGSLTAAAAIHHVWSRGMQGTLQPTDEQKQMLTETGAAVVLAEQETASAQAVTVGDVTVSPEMVIADDKFVYLSFSISGCPLEDGEEPGFEYTAVYCGDDPEEGTLNYSASFYDGIVNDGEGNPVYDDGSVPEKNEKGGYVARYADQDGRLEYVVTAFVTRPEESLLGKTVHAELTNLGTLKKAAFLPGTEGIWKFDIKLPNVSLAERIPVNKEIAGTGFILDDIELSPVSMKLNYSRNGKPVFMAEDMNGIPCLKGVVLRDGTRLPLLINSGMSGYTDSTERKAYVIHNFDRVIDTKQVAALLILKEDGGELVEVPLE